MSDARFILLLESPRVDVSGEAEQNWHPLLDILSI